MKGESAETLPPSLLLLQFYSSNLQTCVWGGGRINSPETGARRENNVIMERQDPASRLKTAAGLGERVVPASRFLTRVPVVGGGPGCIYTFSDLLNLALNMDVLASHSFQLVGTLAGLT